MWRILVVAILLCPTIGGLEVRYHDDLQLAAQVPATSESAQVDFVVSFVSDTNTTAYLKAVASASNPAFVGTGGAAWITTAAWGGQEASTNGSTPIELGPVEDGRPVRLDLTVKAPAGALAAAGDIRLNYALVLRQPQTPSGSGGSLEPSLSIRPLVQVIPMATETLDADKTGRDYWPLGVAIGAVAFIGVRQWRGRGGRP